MSLVVDIEKKLGSFTLRSQFETGSGTMALLGASGCGKSVTLKCIAGIMTPDRGRIVLDGETLFDSDRHIDLTPQQRRVGYLFQQYALFPNMTVAQNIQCGIRSGSRAEKRQQALAQLSRFRLEGLEKKYPAQLSGGQQQRVALARILASEPRAILLDEPFSALDSYLKWNLELELSELLCDFSGPILWVSHDLGECFRNCAAVCVMENGQTGKMTTMPALVQHPDSLSAARLSGCKNFFPAKAVSKGVCLPAWQLTLPLPVDEKTFTTLGIPNNAIVPDGAGIRFRIVRIISDVGRSIVLLRPENAGDNAPVLRFETETQLGLTPGESISLTFLPEKLLLLS